MALWKPKAQAAKDFALSLSCQGKMTQNPSADVVRPSMYTKKSRPLRPRFVRCWWVMGVKAWIYTEYMHQHTIHIPFIPLLPCLNWRDSSRLVWIRWWSFHQAFDAATPCYADLLTLKGAVKFRTFLCSWHRIRGFRPKCMETSWKWNKSSNRRWSSGNPLDAFHDSARPRYSVENDWTLLFPRLEARNPMFVWSLWLSKGQFFGVIDQKSP